MISGRLPYFPGTLASDQVRNQLATAVLVRKSVGAVDGVEGLA